jgi:ADP-ribosylglycohydrolase
MSSTGKCFDIGAATKRSLEEFEQRQRVFGQKYNISPKQIDFLSNHEFISQFNVDCSEKGVAGNGALMRLAPVPLFFYRYPNHAVEFSGVSGRITHGDQSAYDACRYYGALIVAALHGEKKEKLLADNFYSEHEDWFNNKPLHSDIIKIAEGSYKKPGGYEDGIRGKGYIVHALEAALWAFWADKNSFERGVLAAVNLGDDTDTTAAIYGQLAGAYYGYEKLPPNWLKSVYAQNFIRCLSQWIVYEGEIWEPEKSRAFISVSSTPQAQSNTTVGSSSKQNPNSNMHDPSSKPNPNSNMHDPSSKPNTNSNMQNPSSKPNTNSNMQNPSSKPNTNSNMQNPSSKPNTNSNMQNPSSKPNTNSNMQNPSSKPNTNSNMHNPSSKPDSQQLSRTFSKTTLGAGSTSQSTHQPMPETYQNKQSKPNTR